MVTRLCLDCGCRTEGTRCPTCTARRNTQRNAGRVRRRDALDGGSGWARQRLRALILKRDGYRCRQCGAGGRLEIDHIVPLAQGGSSAPANLRALCPTCHRLR